MSETMTEAGRILLIYPPGETVRGMSETLRSEGYAVEISGNVFEAVAAFSREPADLVLLGLAALDERDLEVIRVLRDVHPAVYVLLAFPTHLRERAVKALDLGADSYILEPFYLGEFLDLARRGVERSRAGGAAAPRAGLEEDDLERLAGAVAHAINNPLQILELLLSEGMEGAPDPKDIRAETTRIVEVVDELLDFARRGEHRPAPTDLNRLVEAAVPRPKGRARLVRLDLAEDLPRVSVDERGLRSVFRALAAMARAHDGVGRLTVTTRYDEERGAAEIRFRAPELLLTAAERESFFRPFGGPVPGAVGLATATARTIIEAHGGSAGLESREGEGTTVSVRLPVARAIVPANEEEEERGRLKGG